MYCELCGRKTDRLYLVVIEGAVLRVCESCARYGRKLETNKIKRKSEKDMDKEIVEEYEDIVENYSWIIRKAREKLGLSQEEFSKRYGIGLNVLKKIERGELVPDINLAKKLEKILKVKLIEKRKYTYHLNEKERDKESITLGDIVELK